MNHAALESVHIYFDTATYDEIERDVKVNSFNIFCILSELNYNEYGKVTTEAQLGLIGGTMGLLTGFSILSGVEIIYYLLRFILYICLFLFKTINLLLRFFMSLRIPRADVVSAVKNKFDNHLMKKT